MAYSEANVQSPAKIDALPEAGNEKKRVVVLGTGWAGISFLKNLKNPSYDVQVISPRNYFAFTPLLPSVTVGTVEARSVVEPIRNIVKKVIKMVYVWLLPLVITLLHCIWQFRRSIVMAHVLAKIYFPY